MTIQELTAHNDFLFEKAFIICKDENLAADLVQEMYLKLLQIPKSKVESYKQLKYGAVRMMAQIHIDNCKKKKPIKVELQEDKIEQISEINHQRDIRNIIGRLLWAIPKQERYIFYLYIVKNKTIKSLSESTGISRRTIEYAICKGKEKAQLEASQNLKVKQQLKELGIL
ncbi:MAG: sigma-70 family RNA polymerase sigma factor [Phaeodactylibacter sp.]|nr:sigma-70 family RNA polymerase sigma factor [Phaeodactylibacter sp.]